MRALQEGKITLKPKPPTTVELEIAVDTSKFMRALSGITWDRSTPFERAMAKVQATVDDSQASMDEINQIAKESAAALGASTDSIKTILEGVRDAARPHYGGYGIRPWSRFGETPDQELNRRLNQRVTSAGESCDFNTDYDMICEHLGLWIQLIHRPAEKP